MNKGKLLVISGVSGAGKGTIVKRYMEKYPGESELSISATTREPRPGEREGVEYFFITKKEFEQRVAKGGFLEFAQYVEHYYGTPKNWVVDRILEGKNVILEIEVQGALQVKKAMKDAILMFVLAPTEEEQIKRFKMRGSESDEEIKKRMERAKEEVRLVDKYDYVLVNEDIEKSADMVHNIISSK